MTEAENIPLNERETARRLGLSAGGKRRPKGVPQSPWGACSDNSLKKREHHNAS
jgi:hypothetical protein